MRVATRERLQNRREAETFDVEVGGPRYRGLAEIFLVNHKAGSQAGIMASDAAVVASIALQYGVPLDVIRHALMRDSRGHPSGPLGMVLDRLAAEETPG